MNELKENFFRLFFSKDIANRELAISMKQLIPKEEFIDVIVNVYFEYLKQQCIVTNKYFKLIKNFTDIFRNFLNCVDLYEEPLFTNNYGMFLIRNSKFYRYLKNTNKWYETVMHLKMLNGKFIGKIPFPSIINIYDCINMLKHE
jgi:hypothetical protein